MEECYLRIRDVLGRVPVSKSTWWAWCKRGFAPKPIKLSPGTTVWRKSEIDKFIENREVKNYVKE